MSSAKSSDKKSKKTKPVIKSFKEFYIDYLNSSKSEDDKILLEDEFAKLFEDFDPDDLKPIFRADKIKAVLHLVVENKDWRFLFYLYELSSELFTASEIQLQTEDLGFIKEWYDYLKDFYKNVRDNSNTSVIFYIKETSNEDLFNLIFSESDIEQMTKNNTEEYFFITRQLRSIDSIIDLFKKYTTYGNKELDLICKTKENQFLPFELVTHSVLVPITYYVNENNPLHLIDSKSLVSINSLMNYEFGKGDYDIGLMNYLDIKGLTIDRNFFKRNQEFLRDKLTLKEIFMLSGYTFNGDVLVNLFLRMQADNTDESKENFIEYVENWNVERNRKVKRLIPIFYQLAKRLNKHDYSDVEIYLKKVKKDDMFVELIKDLQEKYYKGI